LAIGARASALNLGVPRRLSVTDLSSLMDAIGRRPREWRFRESSFHADVLGGPNDGHDPLHPLLNDAQ
jgi:hypothetical protein